MSEKEKINESVEESVGELVEGRVHEQSRKAPQNSATTASIILKRDQICPTLVKVILFKGGAAGARNHVKYEDYLAKNTRPHEGKSNNDIDKDSEKTIDLYCWPDSTLEEIGFLLAHQEPTLIKASNLKLVFKAVHVEKLLSGINIKPSISDLGHVFLNHPTPHSTSALFKSKYSIGDLLEIQVLSRADIVSQAGGSNSTTSLHIGMGRKKPDLRSSLKREGSRFAPYSATTKRR